MALRTFRHNPSLGGFGGESLSLLEQESGASEESIHSDAFAQILKELADNAVDACRLDRSPKGKRAQKQMSMRRVRIQIDAETNEGKDVLLVKVSDNGCGMKDIQACVDAFQTSKGHNDKDKSMTSGRYGIGLTCK
jgi:signal transduction histidine kinase